jgi:hypothetical protein
MGHSEVPPGRLLHNSYCHAESILFMLGEMRIYAKNAFISASENKISPE